MAKLTLQERFAIALQQLGFLETKPTAHYRAFSGIFPRGENDIPVTFYLGNSGALRYSKSGKVTKSISASDKTRMKLLACAPEYIDKRKKPELSY